MWSDQEYVVVEKRGPMSRALKETEFQDLMAGLAAVMRRKGTGHDMTDLVALPHCIQTFVSPALQMRFVSAVMMVFSGRSSTIDCCW